MLKANLHLNKMKNKKALLFTITTILLLFSLFYLTRVFSESQEDIQNTIANSGFGDKFKSIEDDISSSSYQELLDINFEGVARAATVTTKFDGFNIINSRDYEEYMSSYKTLVENKYSTLNNIEISLTGVNSSFTIEPYNSTIKLDQQNLTLSTLPLSTNYISSITAYVKVNGTFDCNDAACPDQATAEEEACKQPNQDAGQPSIAITWEDSTPFTCTRTRTLDPTQDNDKSNFQFYPKLLDSGNIEIKYGTVGSSNGIYKLITTDISANITQLDIEYTLLPEPITLKGGNIQITSIVNNITKTSDITLFKE
tara:strand:+ start:248 stop:1183 length:936 start_codon:yes stop_codon:yes gene_type:complete